MLQDGLNERRRWRIWIDTGGTFTDCLAADPRGRLHRAKVLSNGALRGRTIEALDETRLRVAQAWNAPDDFIAGFSFRLLQLQAASAVVTAFDARESVIELAAPVAFSPLPGQPFEVVGDEEAPVVAARLVTGTPAGAPLPELDMRLATTRGTNALLERRGARTAFFVTRGFGDLLRIGNQQRPNLFALDIIRPEPLHDLVIEVDERLDARGEVLRAIDFDALQRDARAALARGVRIAAIALMHSYRHPGHERALRDHLLALGFEHVSCSSDLAPLIRLLPRAQTAVTDAYLASVIERYLARVTTGVGSDRLHVMTSAGGLVRASACHAKDSLLSGPAGGVAGAAAAGRASGFSRIIGFDMGGTSTDVARFDGDFEYVFEHTVGPVTLVAPALAITTVAAGGGSICSAHGGRVRVGPESAGAAPGPACYGAGGPLTLTDVNLLLGRLDPNRFEIPISLDRAREACERVLSDVGLPGDGAAERERWLEGFIEIANERMADAIAQVSVRCGYDPREYALVAFGGAGPQHACGVAQRLGIETVVIPRDASLLSALGLGGAVFERVAQRQGLRLLDEIGRELASWCDELAVAASKELMDEGVPREAIDVRRRIVNLRLLGQDAAIAIEFEPNIDLAKAFAEQYERIYAHAPRGRPIEVESVRVIVSSRPPEYPEYPKCISSGDLQAGGTAFFRANRRAWFAGRWMDASVCERDEMGVGAEVDGPAVIRERHSACVVEPGWRATVDAAGAIVLRRLSRLAVSAAPSRPEAVECELFTNRFTSIAREMGRMLERTALSTNVKERLDFSCTLLDAAGGLVVNAPHMPVHLGAMGLCVRALRETIEMRPGDVVVTNHPAFGGAHLPDVTVVTPVFAGGDELVGYVASRAHHAEIGGTRPGSMPPDARTLAEEGVVIAPMHLIRADGERFETMRELLSNGRYPSRAVEDNLADLRAAVAANHHGAAALRSLAAEHGVKTIARHMQALKERAEDAARHALRRLGDGVYEASERLDDGTPICVRIEIAAGRAVVDFIGAGAQHAGNLNATPAIVRSAVIYVLRLLIGIELPLNEGLMRAVELRIPRGLLDPVFAADPARAPAVVGGNTETSQRIVDTLLKALKLAACSQGTMNNTLFGTDRFGYYETVCGGSGATRESDGAHAVHTHMTNTRITDPEVIEHRYPVRVERFAIRRGSGGTGKHRGGDGAVREIIFLAPMSLSILSQHRIERPYGLEGGEPGSPGRQRVERADGSTLELESIDGCEVQPGDRLVLETPGGGGCGAAATS